MGKKSRRPRTGRQEPKMTIVRRRVEPFCHVCGFTTFRDFEMPTMAAIICHVEANGADQIEVHVCEGLCEACATKQSPASQDDEMEEDWPAGAFLEIADDWIEPIVLLNRDSPAAKAIMAGYLTFEGRLAQVRFPEPDAIKLHHDFDSWVADKLGTLRLLHPTG